MQTNEGCCPPPSARKKAADRAAVTSVLLPEGALGPTPAHAKLAAKGLPAPRYRYIEVRFGACPKRQASTVPVLPRAPRRRAGQARAMGWAGNRVSPQITATPRFPVGSRVLLKPADPKGRKKGMVVDCDGVVISVQETTTKYALRKLWRGVPVQRAYVYCVKTAGGVYATAAETALRRSLDDAAPPAPKPSPTDVVVGKELI